VEPRNPDEVTAPNAAPGVVHLVFIDELPFNIIHRSNVRYRPEAVIRLP
jgi:hypothetical protein